MAVAKAHQVRHTVPFGAYTPSGRARIELAWNRSKTGEC
jgi:hypothetical protein